jgi:acyl-CoA thioester hydrolase
VTPSASSTRCGALGRSRPAEHRVQRPLSRAHPNYADVAITEYFRALGIAYPADLSRDGGDFFAIRTVLEYLAPARFDDLLEIGVRVGRLGRSSRSFNLGIWRGGEALTAGEVIYVHADSASRNSRPLPQWLRDKVRGYEHCAPQE